MLNKQNKIIIIAGIIAITIVVFGVVVWWQVDLNDKTIVPAAVPAEKPDQKITAADAYVLALAKAKEWDPVAKLSKINSAAENTSSQGKADSWELLYTSENKTGLAYRVNIADKSIVDSAEVPFYGAGGELPQNLLTSEEAISRVRQISGYENEPIISVEMIYDAPAKLWFWGVKTGKGTITVNAQK
jgi:hypothetical protein